MALRVRRRCPPGAGTGAAADQVPPRVPGVPAGAGGSDRDELDRQAEQEPGRRAFQHGLGRSTLAFWITSFGAIVGLLIAGNVADRIGGWLLTAGLAYPWGFYIFAVVAATGAVSILLVNRDPAPDEPLPVTDDEADHIGAHGPC